MQNYEERDIQNYTTQDQIADLQKKIHLVEGDLKAYTEQSKETMAKNKQNIYRLRKECKELLVGVVKIKKKMKRKMFNKFGGI